MLSGNKKRIKTICRVFPVLTLMLIMSLLSAKTAFARDVRVFYNGTEIRYDVPAMIINDYTMVPLSQTFEALVGMGTVYDPATRTSTFYANGRRNVHTIGTNVVYVEGAPIYYPTSSAVIGDRALVPIRMITDTSGFNVEWDEVNYFVKITAAQPTPPPATPTPQLPNVQIISFESAKTTLSQNESVVLTVKTNSAATNVWINDGLENKQLTYATLDQSGIKTWVLAYTPKQSATINAYANTSVNTAGAAQKSLSITVNTQPPQITSATSDKTNVAYNESVVLTIKTNSVATNVWVECNNTKINANYVNTDSSGSKVWSATINPSSTQQIRVYANTSDTQTNAATQNISITVGATASIIHSVTPNKTQFNSGEPVTLTIKTNNATQYVWVVCNGTTTNQVWLSSTDSSGAKIWIATLHPNASQQITVYANTMNSQTNAAVSQQYLTVSGSSIVTISSPSANPATVSYGSYTMLTVSTNSSANYVWANTGYSTINFTNYSTDQYGNKLWKYDNYMPQTSQTLTIYAGRSSGSSEAYTSLNINVQGTTGGTVSILDCYSSPSFVYNESYPTNVSFTIMTSDGATNVSISVNGSSRSANLGEFQSGHKYWYVDNVDIYRTDLSSSYVPVTVTASGPAGTVTYVQYLPVQNR